MPNIESKMVLTLALVVLTPIALAACGGGGDTGETTPAATADHGDHAGHDHAAHADPGAGQAHAEASPEAGAGMGGMGGEKVDPEGAVKAFDQPLKAGDKAICPISGEVFIVTDGTATSEYEGKHYGYCCPGCKPKFDAEPAKFAVAATGG
jgi:YHS domain-containing protein